MNKSDIAQIRLYNQQITATALIKPEEITAWLGAMQAQDYAMARWAIGVRLKNASEKTVEAALADGRILRTHLMRPTWHFVAAEDIRWLLKLTEPHLRSTSAAMLRTLEIDPEICRRSHDSIGRALEGGRHLTRNELLDALEKTGVSPARGQRARYLIFMAEIDAIVCSGVKRGKEQTYALLDERIAGRAPRDFTRDEAIAELTKRYFTSHAPATLKDFIWWSGLPTADARKGLEMNKNLLSSEVIENETYWFPASLEIPPKTSGALHLLPAFDEFMVAYKDRTASLDAARATEAVTGNGIFKPIIVIDGRVAGIWKRSFKNDTVVIEKFPFEKLSAEETEQFRIKAEEYARFEGKTAKII